LFAGLIIGASFVVVSSSCHVNETTSDDADRSDVNVQRVYKLHPLPL